MMTENRNKKMSHKYPKKELVYADKDLRRKGDFVYRMGKRLVIGSVSIFFPPIIHLSHKKYSDKLHHLLVDTVLALVIWMLIAGNIFIGFWAYQEFFWPSTDLNLEIVSGEVSGNSVEYKLLIDNSYKELENLFRHVAITKIIEFKSSHTEAGLDFGPFLDKFDVQETNVSEELSGAPNVGKFQYKWETDNGHKTALVWLPICGGVVIEFRISKDNFRWDETGELSEVRSVILNARPTPDALFWDY